MVTGSKGNGEDIEYILVVFVLLAGLLLRLLNEDNAVASSRFLPPHSQGDMFYLFLKLPDT